MSRIAWIFVFALVFSSVSEPAHAAWVKPNKKPTTAWQGFKDSANGAVNNVLPWNWFGGDGQPERPKPGYSKRQY